MGQIQVSIQTLLGDYGGEQSVEVLLWIKTDNIYVCGTSRRRN
jgi:hypothetical protein